jgi:hypothetical protein
MIIAVRTIKMLERSVTEYGYLAQTYGNVKLELQVLDSPAGFYLGTLEDGLPYSQESVEYWPTREAAETAFATGMWTQKLAP